jgi:GDP-L-fucose synthase
MPTNLYGPGDNFDLENSHVLPALVRKFHEAKTANCPHVSLWGTGTPRREFLHVDDLASAAAFLMKCYDSSEILNVGVGYDVTISELAKLIGQCVGYWGDLVFDPTKPDGIPRKLLNVSRLNNRGWRPSIALPDGIRSTYAWFLQYVESGSAIPAVH